MPGTVRVRLTKLRPFKGRVLICSSTTVAPSSDDAVWRSGVSAWISTTSVIAPSSSARSMRTFWSTPSRTFVFEAFLKPVSSALMVYVPVGMRGAVYSPLASVTTLRL